LHEVLAGNFYRAQVESVPEQTWSSAGFLNATVHGLLGLQVDAVNHRLIFAPRIPSDWNDVSIEHLRVDGASTVSLAMHRTATQLTLQLDNPGDAFQCEFTPELPLGAKIGRTNLNARKVSAALEQHAQETDAHVVFDAPHGMSELHLNFEEGVSIIARQSAPLIGEASHGIHVIGVHLEGRALTLDADVPSDRESHLQLQTEWKVANARDVAASVAADGAIDLTFAPNHDATGSYRRAHAVVEFKP
jgi:hypothetical protein